MVKITHIGHACFYIEGATQSLVIDPYDSSIGIAMPHLTADYLLVSHEHYDHNNRAAVDVKYPDTVPPNVRAVSSFHDDVGGSKRGENTIYIIDIDGQKICHLGDLGQILSQQQLSEIGKIDILLVPVGGNYTIDAKQAVAVCRQIQPSKIIPMHYKTAGVTLDIAPLDQFTQLIEQTDLSDNLDVH
jgi:L-ascorbate metabolism protein UlaG (beta-lactamase superfamily)